MPRLAIAKRIEKDHRQHWDINSWSSQFYNLVDEREDLKIGIARLKVFFDNNAIGLSTLDDVIEAHGLANKLYDLLKDEDA